MNKVFYHSEKYDSIKSIRKQIGYLLSILTILVSAWLVYPYIFKESIPCANTISCKEPPKFEIETDAIGIFNNKPVRAPNISLAQDEPISPVLGIRTSRGEKHIFVDLATQTLSAYEGDYLFMQTPISSGLWGRTPTGEFTIWVKLRATRMSGGSGEDYYDLPNVPYVMFFSNNEVSASTGFSLHGTYWHNNFGHAMSHGCVNMKTTDAGKLFEWADAPADGESGTTITIYDSESA